jgi:competence protein ComEA
LKPTLKDFLSFSRKERLGILGLVSLIILIFSLSTVLRNCNNSKINLDEEKLNLAWQKLQAEQNKESIEDSSTTDEVTLFQFDPNTLDSSGFISLGLKPKTVHYLLNWRNKGKHFYKKEDLKPLYSLTEKEYQKLVPFIQVEAKEKYPSLSNKENWAPLPDHINLNKTDSTTLTRLKGIGTFLAHKIIERRNALGGFMKHEQLLEIYKFQDTTYTYLKERLTIDPTEITKIRLNSCSEAQLSAHPYIGEKMAKNILLLRSGLIKYENINQLRQVPLMNEEKYRKIAAYCTID